MSKIVDPSIDGLANLAKYLRELADYADRVRVLHVEWTPEIVRKRLRCPTCQKRRYRADLRKRRAARAAELAAARVL